MSLGSRSGVNWTRRTEQSTERASAFASIVLPTPGTSSISRCPSASSTVRASRTTEGLPSITDSTASRILFAMCASPSSPGPAPRLPMRGAGQGGMPGVGLHGRLAVRAYCHQTLLSRSNRQYVVGTPTAMFMGNASPLCSTGRTAALRRQGRRAPPGGARPGLHSAPPRSPRTRRNAGNDPWARFRAVRHAHRRPPGPTPHHPLTCGFIRRIRPWTMFFLLTVGKSG